MAVRPTATAVLRAGIHDLLSLGAGGLLAVDDPVSADGLLAVDDGVSGRWPGLVESGGWEDVQVHVGVYALPLVVERDPVVEQADHCHCHRRHGKQQQVSLQRQEVSQ